ncbi:MAG: uroporphyrinogen-III synthase [Crocinitomicaceae bacterium]|nr:uroporphyrinogen-III synthase [Crocinitomicaceae bacterium]
MSRIFISKDPEDLNEGLHALQQNGILEAQALIDFEDLPFDCPSNYDILFIASIRAAEFFLSRCTTTALIACAGLETAKKVAERYQKEVVFIAQQSGLPKAEAERFNTWRKGRSICFPSSQLSIGTYAALIPDSEKMIVPVYNTRFKKLHIKEKDIYVFSSPSNVLAFLEHNTIPSQAKVVAWGSSTAQELTKQQISVTKVLSGQQQTELLTWLSKIL